MVSAVIYMSFNRRRAFKREDKRGKMRNHELYFKFVDQTDRKKTRKSNITRHLRPERTG